MAFSFPFLRLQDSDRYLELTHCPDKGARNVQLFPRTKEGPHGGQRADQNAVHA